MGMADEDVQTICQLHYDVSRMSNRTSHCQALFKDFDPNLKSWLTCMFEVELCRAVRHSKSSELSSRPHAVK